MVSSQIVIAALYRFVQLEDYRDLRQPLLAEMMKHQVRGSLLLAAEGINGTIAGQRPSIDAVLAFLRAEPRLLNLDCKLSFADSMPFYRSRVKLKKEIVTMGVEGIDPAISAGTYVDARDWNALISDPDVTVIDTRNNYEVAIGSFANAQNPQTDSFRDFPAYVAEHLDVNKNRKVAMFCTGGIRCEKSTAYLKQQGFESVFHLQGGILKYLEEVPQTESLWQGECFVFDNRVSVDHNLEPGGYHQCHACRLPISAEDMLSPHYQQGVSCPACYDAKTDSERSRFRQREQQVKLARQRGESHIGAEAVQHARHHKASKLAIKEKQRKRASC